MDRRTFLTLAAVTPLVALAPWRRSISSVKRVAPPVWASYLHGNGAFYRYMNAVDPGIQKGDLVWSLDGRVCGVSAHDEVEGTVWVQVSGPYVRPSM